MTDALDYIPHSGKMALIDKISDVGENWIECLVDPSKTSLFSKDESIPSWLGIEYMAQTIAAYAGWKAKKSGEAVKMGFLLGTRKYKCLEKTFYSKLKVKAEVLFQSDELASFSCCIRTSKDDISLAKARINVYQPKDFSIAIQDELNE